MSYLPEFIPIVFYELTGTRSLSNMLPTAPATMPAMRSTLLNSNGNWVGGRRKPSILGWLKRYGGISKTIGGGIQSAKGTSMAAYPGNCQNCRKEATYFKPCLFASP